MAKYIQYYQKVTPNLIECVGGDSVIKPDQRYSIYSLILGVIRGKYCVSKNAIGFAICKGNNVYNLTRVTDVVLFTNK